MKPFPKEGRVRTPQVVAFTGLSTSTLMRRAKAGTGPAPVRCGARSNLWDAASVREWAADPEGWRASAPLDAQATNGATA